MILPNFILPDRINRHWKFSGMDSFEYCKDKQHFLNFPYKIIYDYNSRGYRDQEWPDDIDQLKSAIWCIGDSFTVGIGSPQEHTWTWLLQQRLKNRTINVSMDGASNNWISRQVVDIIHAVSPKNIVIHWSYLHRREYSAEEAKNVWWNVYYKNVKDPNWPECTNFKDFEFLPKPIKLELEKYHPPGPYYQIRDDDRRIPYSTDRSTTDHDDVINILKCISTVEQCSKTTKIIHSFIPDFGPAFSTDLEKEFLTKLVDHTRTVIRPFKNLDLARDGHHYDLMTSCYFVDQIVPLLT